MSSLRDDYDPTDVPLNSSAIMKIDTSGFDLAIEDDMASAEGPAVNADSLELAPEPTASFVVSPRVQVQRALNRIVYRIYRSRPLQLAWAAVIVACLALMTYSLTTRVDHIDDNILLLAELGELDTQLLSISRKWSLEEMKALEQSVASADTRRVFLDYRSLAIWLREKAAFAEQLGLEFGYSLGGSEASQIEDMYEVPVLVTLSSNAENGEAYLRTLEFLKRVVSTPFYVEITETALTGEGRGARQLQATLRVWVHSSVKAVSNDAQ
ncbi:MAG: hypothetical protein AAFY69_01700 [Pseudomonadota bacterium]